MSIRGALKAAITEARRRAIDDAALTLADPAASLPDVGTERPAKPEHGDWASNVAMQMAPVARAAPMQIAEAIQDRLVPPDGIAAVEIAPPGFLNFRLDPAWVGGQVSSILDAGEGYGLATAPTGTHTNVEFVSANPTGPLTIGNARGAFVGDLLCRVLEGAGVAVTREYYFNDASTQVRNLGLSIVALRRGEPIPEDGYRGDYVAELADALPESVWDEAHQADVDAGWVLGRWASERVREQIEASLAQLGVRFDVWKGETSLHAEGWVERGIERLRAEGYVYEDGGALWFRSTAFGDDKDRVVIRSNGEPTYFAADIGYIAEKFSRGFDQLIYIWGADHHGTVARNRNAAVAMGFDAEAVQWLLVAWVRFVRDGREISMSKRSGEFITLDELLAEIGADAARWFFGSRAASTGIDFDIELAKRQSAENPVYYVQYAHARCCSILRHAAEAASRPDPELGAQQLHHPAEQALIKRMLDLPDVVADSAHRRETHDIPHYAHELAGLFSQFYRDCRVLTDDAPLTSARLALVDATRLVLRNCLALLGISAPETM